MITFVCPGCSRPFKVTTEALDSNVRCPRCSQICRVQTPAVLITAGSPSPTALPDPELVTQEAEFASEEAMGSFPSAPSEKRTSDAVASAMSNSASSETASKTISLPVSPDVPAEPQTKSQESAVGPTLTGTVLLQPPTNADLPAQIGRFLIRRCLGEGAFGRVYQAYDPQLDRLVALKVAKLDRGDAEHRVKRFVREAKAAAGLRHPHIVPLFECGRDGDQFFMASAFIEGRTLKEEIERRRQKGSPDLSSAARIIRQLAEALAYAHAHRIVHRDVKPSNTMLDEKDEPFLMDFGLASRPEEAERITHVGTVLGTPMYMAPEQAVGKETVANPASDQYSLGVMLYELLTNHPPFRGKPELVMYHHVETEPDSPRKLNAKIPRDLETICLKCLHKDPKKRYADCQALADDLRRWQEGEPILARPESSLVRTGRLVRRHPWTVAALSGLILVLGIAFYAWVHINSARHVADLVREIDARQEADFWTLAEREKSEQLLTTLEQQNFQEARDVRQRFHERYAKFLKEKLSSIRLTPETVGNVSEELQWLRARDSTLAAPLLTLLAQRQLVADLVRTADDGAAKKIADLADRERTEKVLAELEKLDPNEARKMRQKFHDRVVQLVEEKLGRRLTSDNIAFIKTDIQWLAERNPGLGATLTAQLDERQRKPNTVLELKTPFKSIDEVFAKTAVQIQGQALRRTPEFKAEILPTRVGSGGPVEVEALFDESWETASAIGVVFNMTLGHPDTVENVVFSPNAQYLASVDSIAGIKIWDLVSGKELRTIFLGTDRCHALAFSPDSKILAVGCEQGVRFWNVGDGKEQAGTSTPKERVYSLAYSSRGEWLAIGGRSRVYLFNPSTQSVAWEVEQKRPTYQLAFLPDASAFAALGSLGEVTLWNVSEKQGRTALQKAVAISPNASLAVTLVGAYRVVVELSSGREIARLWKHGHRVAFSPDAQRFAQMDGSVVQVHSLGKANEDFSWTTQANWFSTFCFGPSGHQVATGSYSGGITLWELDKTLPKMTLGGQHYLFRLRPGEQKRDPATADKKIKNFAQTKAEGAASVTLEIIRNGIILRQDAMPYPRGPLLLTARRDGPKLVFQVNNSKEIIFYDPLPLRSTQTGVFGLLWPAEVGLLRLQGITVGLPQQPSAIEKADDYFDNGRYSEAYRLYLSLVGADKSSAQSQEARYKAAACLVDMNRLDDAAMILESLVKEKGEQWPMLAAFQLWHVRAQQKRFEDIDGLLVILNTRFGVNRFSQFIPGTMQLSLLNALATQPSDYVTPGLKNIQKTEQHVALAKLFFKSDALFLGRYNLIAAYAYSGQNDKALEVSRELLRDIELDVRAKRDHAMNLFGSRRALWMMYRAGEFEPALEQLDRILFESPNVIRSVADKNPRLLAPLYLDRARLFYARKNLVEAEANLDAFFVQCPVSHNYRYWANAYLMKGFLLEKQGKKEEALKIWREGLYSRHVQRQQPEHRDLLPKLPDREGLLLHGVLASLTGEMSDAEANAIRQESLAQVGSTFVNQAAQLFPMPPVLLRQMWQSRLGKIWAEKLAFLDLSLPEFYRLPPRMVALEKIRLEGSPRPLTVEQEDVIWQAVVGISEDIFSGKIEKTQAFYIVMTWNGAIGFLGWGDVAKDITPAVRGPLAYTLGLKQLQDKQYQKAELLFSTAVKDAPANSVLRRLAQAELDAVKTMAKKAPGK